MKVLPPTRSVCCSSLGWPQLHRPGGMYGMAQVGRTGPRPLGADVWSPSWREALRSPLSALGRSLEAEQERWFLWLPVLFGAGIALYFPLPTEPSTWNALLPVAASLALLLAGKRQWPGALVTAGLLALACGVAAARVPQLPVESLA